MDALHYLCLAYARQTCAALDLPGIGDRWYLQALPDETEARFPCGLVTAEGEAETVSPLTSASRLVEYPARLLLCDRTAPTKGIVPVYTGWRQRVLDAFPDRKRNLPAGCHGVRVVPQIVFDERLPQYQFIVSGMVLWFKAVRPN